MASEADSAGDVTVTVRCNTTEEPGRGWVAHAPELRATAQGRTEEEAVRNLAALITKYPDLLEPLFEEVRKAPQRHLELLPA